MSKEKERPLLALTMGDPAGIGPEIIVKVLAMEETYHICRPLVVGALAVFREIAPVVGSTSTFHPVSKPSEGRYTFGTVDILDLANADPCQIPMGKVSALAGRAAVETVLKAGELALTRQVDAIVTGPLNKEAMQLASFHYLGHTEILAEQTGTKSCTTLLASRNLRVIHTTRHIPLKEVAGAITLESVLETIHLTHEGLQDMGIDGPYIVVAGLNPHNGDGGLLGREEIEVIGPAVEAARAEGVNVEGPFPSDSMLYRVLRDGYDAVIAMYHDQGHILVKTYGFEESYTVTLGLPIIRTSVDHGTAFGKAGKGTADPRSLVEAIKAAVQIALHRSRGS